MADLTKGTIGVDAISASRALILTGLIAGEALLAGDAVYIKSDGKVYQAVSTALDLLGDAAFDGMVNSAYAAGDAVTVFGQGTIMSYGASLTPGALYFVSAAAGKLSDAAIVVGDIQICKAISASEIVVLR